jgi:hypothetical protein
VSYNFLQDSYPSGTRHDRHQTSHQMSVGILQIIDEATTMGIVITDPTRTTPGEERLLAGFQYQVASRFVLIGDVGAQYTKSFSDNYLWRAAAQLNIFSDFFVRGGTFHENMTKSKGTGWGVAWIGPRLGIEFAQKMTEYYGSGSYMYKDEKLVDTSLSAIIKF